MDQDNDSGCNEDRRQSVSQRDEFNSSIMNSIDSSCVQHPNSGSYLSTKDLGLETSVDPRDYPSYEIAQRLFDHYTATVHDWFPILPVAFINQLKRSYQSPLSVANTWTATLNLVCAIGAQHSFLTTTPMSGCNNKPVEREDVVFLSKALLLLEVQEASLLTALPDLAQVRCLGLLSFYYLGAGHVDRAWITIGIAVRLAMALDLHLENPSDTSLASDVTNSALVWWSLRTLESLLGSITNRPTSISLSHCSVSYPRISSYEDYASSTARNLRAFLRVHMVSQAAVQALYSIGAAAQPWTNVLDNIEKYKDQLERLLPVMSDHERLMLHFSWCDAMIVVTRPCLGSRASINSSGKLLPRDGELARQCIKAAQSTAKLLPDEPDTHIFQNGPWWCLVHYIMRAVTVLLVSSSRENLSALIGTSELIASVTKLSKWLQWLQQKDTVAERGLQVVLDMIQRLERNEHFTDVLKQQTLDLYRTPLSAPSEWSMHVVDSAFSGFVQEGREHTMDVADLQTLGQIQNGHGGLSMPVACGPGFGSNNRTPAWN
ncbi:hypothetical protein NX059_008473 [Plenodomus lindquistii]|nr:hypothetical protein NX059_008473 [Plenodomus lindquistii]